MSAALSLAGAPVSTALDDARHHEKMVAQVTARSLRAIRRRVERIVFLAAARRDGDLDAVERLAAELLAVIAEERHWIRAEHAALKKAIAALDKGEGLAMNRHERRQAAKGFKPQADPGEAHKDRVHMLEQNVSLLPAAWKSAKAKGITDPVFFIGDMADPVVDALTQNHPNRDQEFHDKLEASGQISTAVGAIDRPTVIEILRAPNPTVSAKLAEGPIPSQLGAYVLAIASGGTLITVLPAEAFNGPEKAGEA